MVAEKVSGRRDDLTTPNGGHALVSFSYARRRSVHIGQHGRPRLRTLVTRAEHSRAYLESVQGQQPLTTGSRVAE